MRIRKTVIKRDAQGNPIYKHTDELVSNPQGTDSTMEMVYERCPNCNKTLVGVEDIRLGCAFCNTQMCANCEQKCQACGRGVCYHHRSSYAPAGVTYCQECVPSKRAVEKLLLKFKMLESKHTDLPGNLGVIAKLWKNHQIKRLERKIEREL